MEKKQNMPVVLGAASAAYVEELKNEVQQLDAGATPHAVRLLNEEVKRLEQGGPKKVVPLVEAHHDRPQAVALKIRVPQNEYPKFNFVGKLLGPKGMSLKRLQEETGTKMSILGKGSTRDKNKEEEMKKEGGKYAHLNEDLHILVEVYSEISDSYTRLSYALTEIHKFLSPEYNDEIAQQQMQEMMLINGGDKSARGRGRGRGGPAGVSRGGILGGGPSAAPPVRSMSARGAPRGAAAPRGARGAPRGAPAGRGRPAPPPAPVMDTSYEDYSATGGYEDYSDPYARDSYDASYGAGSGDTQYFDYGHGTSASTGYEDSYGGDSGWGVGGGQMKAPSARGARGQFRSHPYGGARGAY